MNSPSLARTPLFDRLVQAGGRMVDFHGWEMPVQFGGILSEHRAVRTACGVFDVSHMGQIFLSGPDAHRLVEKLNCNRMSREPGRGVPRAGCSVWQGERRVGTLTSATFAPSLQTGIGVGYLAPEAWEPGTRVEVDIHGKRIEAETVRGPFRTNSV